jgi:3-dehydrotetronate 4-kinase
MRARPTALLGCIADDFTGATDLASTLVAGGMRTVQTIGIPPSMDPADADAIVVALKTRTIAPDDAVRQSLDALDWLRAQGCRQFFFKYCSTFDSTSAGNIGPVGQALMAATGARFAIACPAFPANGRTVYQGYLFVGSQLLSESSMRDHPLTPMRDASLVRVLQAQTTLPVGLLDHSHVAAGVPAVQTRLAALHAQGARFVIADAIDETDLRTLGTACAEHRLVTGGSGMALGLPDNFRRAGLLPARTTLSLPHVAGRSVVLSGSASRMTNRQVAAWQEAGRPSYRLDPLRLSAGDDIVDAALAFALDHPDPVLVFATCGVAELADVQARLGAQAAGAMIERAMGDLARRLRDAGFRRFVVAGGETSGAVVLALGVTMLQIGPPIAPGVPLTVSPGPAPLALTLKSGNFGAPDFFCHALAALEGGNA